MCVAIIITAEARPTLQDFQNMARSNADGAGVGWATDGRAHWVKGLQPEDLCELIDALPRPVLVHFRFATAGGAIPQLCHPFPIDESMTDEVVGSASEILIHNGHWYGWEEYYKTYCQEYKSVPAGAWSDTRFAALLMHQFPSERPEIAAEVGGKIALLDGATGEAFYWGHWEEENGIMYSNTYWKASRRGYGMADMYDWWKGDSDDTGTSNPRSGRSHRYQPYSYRGYDGPTPPKATQDDAAWEKYWLDKKAHDASKFDRTLAASNLRAGYDESDFADEPTEPEYSMTFDGHGYTATEELRAAQEASDVANKMVAGSSTHQLREVTKMVNGVVTRYFELGPKE